MKLAELSQKPKLLKVMIDREDIIEKYGEELEFFVYDRQPLDVFSKLANANTGDLGGTTMLLKDLILDEDGNCVMKEDNILPMDVMIEAIKLIGDRLGK